MLDFVSKNHKEWLRIAMSFLGNKEDAEDLVQDFYLRLHKYNVKRDKILYKDEINKYFIYINLRNLALDAIRKRKEYIPLDELDVSNEVYEIDYRDELLERIDEYVSQLRSYDRDLFTLKMYSGLSLRDIAFGSDKELRHLPNRELKKEAVARGSGISVSSIHSTIKFIKNNIKKIYGQTDKRIQEVESEIKRTR